MGLLEKVRDFFYDDEEDIVEETPKKEKIKHSSKEKKYKIKFDNNKEQKKNDISERELFKAERTFNFPLEMDEEENKEVKKVEEIKFEQSKTTHKIESNSNNSNNKPLSIRNYQKYEKTEEKIENKFKPTPVISPIYGILDKNYKKEDLLIDTAKESDNKKTDYNTVRKRAYSKVYDNEGDNESKEIFFNLKEKKSEDDDKVKIVYNDVTFEDETDKDKNITIGEKIEQYENSLKEDTTVDYEEDDDQILSETKEQDLFNLIDNMYNSEEDEEEEE